MKLIRSISSRLEPTDEQSRTLAQWVGAPRFVYNLALEQRRDWWRPFRRSTGRSICAAAQSTEITELRKECDWINAVPRVCLEQALRDLEQAFNAFFVGRSTYPTPRRRGENDSIRFQKRGISVRRLNAKWCVVTLPKIGEIKFREDRQIDGYINNATVSRGESGWRISFACTVENETPSPKAEALGIDRGVATTIAISTGEMFSLPSGLTQLERRRRRAQRKLNRCKKGSRRRDRQKHRVARLQAKLARVRRHFHHSAALYIATRCGVAVIEKLDTTSMTASAKGTVAEPGKNVRQKAGLNRSILNAGWYAFEQILTYKMEERGGIVIKVPAAYSSQTCSACGVVDARSRKSQAVFACVSCGHRDHADVNAAKEILRRGSTPLLRVEGPGCGPGEARTLALREHGLNLAHA